MRRTRPRHFSMAICVRRLCVLVVASSVAHAACADAVSSECGVLITLPDVLTFSKDSGVQSPLCSLLDANSRPTPFVNSITVVPWAKLDDVRVNGQPLRDIGFFRLSQPRSTNYRGRPTYADPRNGYEQRVSRRTTPSVQSMGTTTLKIIKSEVTVTWLKPVEKSVREEATEGFICVDAAVSNASSVALVNWCLPKNDPDLRMVEAAIRSLKLK